MGANKYRFFFFAARMGKVISTVISYSNTAILAAKYNKKKLQLNATLTY
jgi:hypothetical protein